jgi:hypothetical protein
MERLDMLVITRNGKTIVLTGWRAWLAGAVTFAAVTMLLAVVAFVLLGAAITLGAVLLIVVPVAIGLAIIASVLRAPRVG